ncbi:glycosyltransferase [Sphingomonas immobilis]|uniref:Glycosyltransferase n=1 Tax=Sphingomonas immobilis TaxID=3063997 RepID=A0ABT8ZTM2_9SPHN|nr:glycosyltransferase [Sphingomonas sp. CA1-15]MDO7840924.1 glycosyltransferase [Sphingomonas sp. CA1-15]
MTERLSVVICTHNPRDAYFTRVLAALEAQTMPRDAWELVVIDNASKEPLSERYDLSWHPSARFVVEPELGLTPARMRAIDEAVAPLMLFVDDDNVLQPDYLQVAADIGDTHSFLGAWGAGILDPEFESPPEPWAEPHLIQLALRHYDQPHWSNDVSHWESTPVGAGMCIRTVIARLYREELRTDPARARLDRKGDSLDGAGDLDMAYVSRKFGLGWGTFPILSLLHLMPAFRISEDYLLRITEAANASLVVLASRVGRPIPVRQNAAKRLVRGALTFARGGAVQLRFFRAADKGVARGLRMLND